MFHAFFIKLVATISTILGILFPFTSSTNISYQATTTPQTHIAATTNKTISQKTALTKQVTTTPIKKVAQIPQTTSPQTSITAQQTTTAPIPPKTQTDFDHINTTARSALVNIICTTKNSGSFSAISGSGVIVSPNGVILTNAHIAQYFLLKNFNSQNDFVDCTIRTGSPAYPTYNAELVYISPTWVEQNKDVLVEQNPTGTGEHDYAFLKITSRVDGTILSTSLPYVPPDTAEDTLKGGTILLASYPAEFFGSINIIEDLYQTTAITQVSDVYTFNKNTVDLISVPGTVVSQKGSSGGAVINDTGKLIGIITTSSDASTTGARDLRAITVSYINRDLATVGTNIKSILDNPASVSDTFNQTIARTLTKILTNSILGK